MDKRNAKIILLIVLGVIVVGIIWTVASALYRGSKVQVTTDSAPTDLILTIDGKRVANNKTFLMSPGKHTWKAQREGFGTRSESFTLVKGQPKKLLVYIQPSNAIGLKYLADHPNEAYRIEGLVGSTHDEIVDTAKDKTPLIGQLPFIGPGFEFRVDYGETPTGAKFPGQTGIYISANTDAGKQDALDWIKSQGYDPDKLNIVYQPYNN